MKTPREIILEKHRAAEEKLDAIRAEELASLARVSTPEPSRASIGTVFRSAFQGFWQQAFWPWHRAWAGMAAIWIGILALHLFSSEPTQSVRVEAAATRNPQVLSALREQNRLLVQLLEPGAAPSPKTPVHSGPRSEQRHELFIA